MLSSYWLFWLISSHSWAVSLLAKIMLWNRCFLLPESVPLIYIQNFFYFFLRWYDIVHCTQVLCNWSERLYWIPFQINTSIFEFGCLVDEKQWFAIPFCFGLCMFFHLGAELLSSFFNVDTVALSAGNFVYYALILFFFFLNKSLLENSNDEWHSHKVVEQKFKTLHTETSTRRRKLREQLQIMRGKN